MMTCNSDFSLTEAQIADMKQTFSLYDTDKDGLISAKEMHLILLGYKAGLHQDVIDELSGPDRRFDGAHAGDVLTSSEMQPGAEDDADMEAAHPGLLSSTVHLVTGSDCCGPSAPTRNGPARAATLASSAPEAAAAARTGAAAHRRSSSTALAARR